MLLARTAENCFVNPRGEAPINHSRFSVSDSEFDRVADVAVPCRFPRLWSAKSSVWGQSFGVTVFGSGLSPNHTLDLCAIQSGT
jgi:hypothetical protein